MKTAMAAWTNTWSRSPLRTATMPAMPPRKMYARELERCAVQRTTDDRDDGDDDRRDRGVEQDREQHPDGRRRQEVAEDRATGRDLERERRSRRAAARSATSTLSRCQSVGRKRQIQASSIATVSTASRNQPAKWRGRRCVLAEPERLDGLDVGGVEPLPVRGRRLGPARSRPSPAGRSRQRASCVWSVRVLVERRVRDDERGDELGRQHPLGLVEVAGHAGRRSSPGSGPPPCRAARYAACASRTLRGLGPDRRPAGRVDREQRGLRRLAQVRRSLSRAAPCAPPASGPSRTRCRRGGPARSNAVALLVRRSRSPLSVVKSYCGGTAARGFRAGLLGEGLGCRTTTAFGAVMSLAGELAELVLDGVLGQDVDGEDRGHGHDEARRGDRRGASRRSRVNRARTGARWVSIGRLAGQCGLRSWAARSAWASALATRPLTTLPSARPRVRGASQPMTLPMSRALVAPVAAIASSTSAPISASLRGCGRYSSRMSISACSLAARSARPALL